MVSKIRLTGENATIALGLLEEASAVLTSHRIGFCVDSGTLLGIVRENRLLPWDNDLDFSVFAPEKAAMDLALEEFRARGFEVQVLKLKQDLGPLRRGTLRLCKITRQEVLLDLIVKYPHEDFHYWVIWGTLKRAPAHFYEPLSELAFGGVTYPVPGRLDEYLTYRYGDWRTPKKTWDIRKDDGAIV